MLFKKKKQLNQTSPGLVTLNKPMSHISEQFRTIRTNIQFSMIDDTLKSIVVTSANSDAGKSTLAANLASTFASEEKRVLLVDADLRKPTVHKIFSVRNTEGLTTLLTDREAELDDLVVRTRSAGLYVLSSGAIPPNPAEMLGSNRMKEVEKEMMAAFDLVIFDMPPVLVVTDAQVMASRADGVLFVIPKGQEHKDSILKAKDLLDKVQANVLGAVLNKVEDTDTYTYYYGLD
ncbi:capsular exopolysaccharide family [Alkalibacterium subtropicum]|uniref:non-specific protein-tyrosine kinase n=1 Tax=Alkalibacterium subtropicum TaxID=753702 RepID=A0A1I1GI15_9LACT|nr:CpsD/CapB family tyrosine-protein kinase [Alkalibacterium subtropicum]SFC10912.1 capsular exopolysaccharide family [Alkalibacterium subtropicum]